MGYAVPGTTNGSLCQPVPNPVVSLLRLVLTHKRRLRHWFALKSMGLTQASTSSSSSSRTLQEGYCSAGKFWRSPPSCHRPIDRYQSIRQTSLLHVSSRTGFHVGYRPVGATDTDLHTCSGQK